MTPQKWEQVTEIYHSALELSEAERQVFLELNCAGDDALRREVESLIAADAQAETFIAQHALKDAAHLFAENNSFSLIGQNLAHHRIISRLGAGGMGEVYLATDTKLNRPVAVKILPPFYLNDQNYLQRFETEARAAAQLNHQNIAVLYSIEETSGQKFMTLEYVAGKTLDDLIPAHGLDLKTFLKWFIPLADALAHAHEKGIVHRDIKPGNIMITPEGAPKILDFGLAQIDPTKISDFAPTLKITEPGQIFGTPSYMSPEQAEGKEVDHRSDIFSFGAVMYEAITGTRPFAGASQAEILSNLLKSEPQLITDLKSETPSLIARLIKRCLEKSRQNRFQTMSEVRALLQETSAAVEAGILSDDNLKTLARRQKSFSLLSLTAIILLTVAALSALVFFYPFAKRPQTPIGFENMTMRRLSQSNNIGFAQITPDGKSIVYYTIEENDNRALWIRRVEEKAPLQLVPPQPAQFWGGFSVSPDNNQIFYVVAPPDAKHGSLYRVSSLGGAPRKLVEAVNDVGAVSPDGRRKLHVRYGQPVQLLAANTADGGDAQVIQTGESNNLYRDPQFSSDGKSIFFIKFEPKNGAEFWSLAEIPATGGRERTILEARKERIGEIAVLKDGSGLLINKTDAVSNLQQIFFVSLADGKTVRTTNDLNFYAGVSASDDGEKIVATQRSFAKDIWIKSGVGEMKKITTESNIGSNAVWTPDGRIVYEATDNNRSHIWIMNADGSGAQQLTPNDSVDAEPRVSPDNRFIVFTSERTGERKIWRMNLDGSNPQLLTEVAGAAFAPVIAPDGSMVWFQWIKDNKRVLGRVSLQTGGEIIEQPFFGDNLWTFAPHGKQIAYAFYDEQHRQYKVALRLLERSEPSDIFDISPANFLVWTTDGNGLLYREIGPSAASNSTVWLQSLAGGEPKPFFNVKPDQVFAISQSRDGEKFAVVRGKLLTDVVMLSKIRPN